MGDDFLDLDNHDGPGNDQKKEEEQRKDDEQLLDGKFKTVDELVKSYKELEGKFTQDSQEKSELKRQLAELQQKVTKTETKEEPVDLDALFWEKPSAMLGELEKRVAKLLEPLAVNAVENQKSALRKDPDFVKYEKEVDDMLKALPSEVRNQPNVIGELFNLVKGRHLNDILEDYKKKIKEEFESGREGAVFGGLEEPTGGEHLIGKSGLPKLTAEEKRVAEQFNPDLAPAEAHKKYAEKKAKLEKLDQERMRR